MSISGDEEQIALALDQLCRGLQHSQTMLKRSQELLLETMAMRRAAAEAFARAADEVERTAQADARADRRQKRCDKRETAKILAAAPLSPYLYAKPKSSSVSSSSKKFSSVYQLAYPLPKRRREDDDDLPTDLVPTAPSHPPPGWLKGDEGDDIINDIDDDDDDEGSDKDA
jgi:hypothetical protein